MLLTILYLKGSLSMQQSALVLAPPIIVLATAVITRKLSFSLILGLITGAFIASQGKLSTSTGLLFERISEQFLDHESLFIYLFLLCVGILISVLDRTGGATAFAQILSNKITHKRQIKNTSIAISAMLSLDDYLSSLTVGHIMKPLADSFHVARAKLAYMVHTFAGPLVILIPISTWGAFITAQIEQTGISTGNQAHVKIAMDPFFVFLQSIPFIYYSIFTMLAAIYIINSSISYGPMYYSEQRSLKAPDKKICNSAITGPANAYLSDLLIPLCTLLGSVICGLLYMGNCYLFGGTESIACSLQHNQNAFQVLGIAGLITLGVALSLAFHRKQILLRHVPGLIAEGCTLMGPIILLVILSSALGSVLRIDLQTGRYLAQNVLPTMQVAYLPLIFFIVGSICSSLIGIGWGAIALLLPIGVPMAFSMINTMHSNLAPLTLIIPTIGAILAGSVFGDHTSPIAAACEIAASTSGCSTAEHVRTQFPYTIAPFIGSCVAYLITGMMLGSPIYVIMGASLGAGSFCTLIIIFCMNRLWHKRKQ